MFKFDNEAATHKSKLEFQQTKSILQNEEVLK